MVWSAPPRSTACAADAPAAVARTVISAELRAGPSGQLAAVNLLHLGFGLLDRVLGGHALNGRAGEHVDDHVLGEHFVRLRGRLASVAQCAGDLAGGLEWQQRFGPGVPQRALLEAIARTDAVALLQLEPRVELLGIVDGTQGLLSGVPIP